MDSILEARGLPDEICALSHELSQIPDIFRRAPRSRDQVCSQQLSQGLGIDLVRLDSGFGLASVR
jgi:hypothetical protein